MDHDKTFSVELTVEEFYSLRECLGHLRKRIDEDYQQTELARRREPIQDPIFVAASKLAKVENPDLNVTLQDFLNYSNYGLNN